MRRKNSLLHLSEPEKKLNFLIFYSYEHLKCHWAWKKFYNLGPWTRFCCRAKVYVSILLATFYFEIKICTYFMLLSCIQFDTGPQNYCCHYLSSGISLSLNKLLRYLNGITWTYLTASQDIEISDHSRHPHSLIESSLFAKSVYTFIEIYTVNTADSDRSHSLVWVSTLHASLEVKFPATMLSLLWNPSSTPSILWVYDASTGRIYNRRRY